MCRFLSLTTQYPIKRCRILLRRLFSVFHTACKSNVDQAGSVGCCRFGNTVVVHFEDMAHANLDRLLRQYRGTLPCFSDDVQVGSDTKLSLPPAYKSVSMAWVRWPTATGCHLQAKMRRSNRMLDSTQQPWACEEPACAETSAAQPRWCLRASWRRSL